MAPTSTSKAAEEERPEPLSTSEVVQASRPPAAYPRWSRPAAVPRIREAERLRSARIYLDIPAVHRIQGIALGLDADTGAGTPAGYGDHIQIHAGGQYPAVIMVGMIAADFGPSGSGEEMYLPVAEGLQKLIDQLRVAKALSLHRRLAVQGGKKGIVPAAQDVLP